MNGFRKALVASAVALACAAPAASAQYSNFYIFGDSLSDAGSYAPVLPPGTGRFTTNPDPVWAQVFGAYYGATITPANQGGTDYAQGGARVSQSPGVPPTPPTGSALPIAQQVSQYIGRGVDSGAFHGIWGGMNDIFTQLALVQAGQITSAQAQANVVSAATQYVQQVAALQAAGANQVVVFNLPDFGKTPYGIAAGPAAAAQISAIVSLYNTTVQTGLDALGGNVIRGDTWALLNAAIANPAAFGLTNVTGRACGSTTSLLCTPANLVAPDANQTYVFADDVHPTGASHMIVAQALRAMLEGPQQVATLTTGPMAVEQSTFRAVDARMWSALDTPYAPRGLNVWASYDYAHPDIDLGSISGDASLSTLSIGGDVRVNPHLMAGAAVHFGWYDASYNGGSHKMNETAATLYGGWGSGPWYAGASLLLGYLDFSDLNRDFALGTTSSGSTGDTSGTHWGVRALGGYWFKHSNVLHGPFAKLVYQRVSVNAFSEGSSSTIGLRYDGQDRDSLIGSLGWQAQGSWGAVRPFGRVTWEYEFKDDPLSVSVSPSLGGTYTVQGASPDSSWAQFVFGGSMDFGQPSQSYGRLSGYLMGTATAGKSDGDSWSVTVGLRMPM